MQDAHLVPRFVVAGLDFVPDARELDRHLTADRDKVLADGREARPHFFAHRGYLTADGRKFSISDKGGSALS
jgi:hypothetical protein